MAAYTTEQQIFITEQYIRSSESHEKVRRAFQVLKNTFIPFLQGFHGSNLTGHFFMQDGARPHRTETIFSLLNEHFRENVIALDYPKQYGSGIDWPPYSADLSPLDFFLWGHLKDEVYQSNPKTLEQLESSIEREILAIPTDVLHWVVSDFGIRLRTIVAVQGKHIEHVVI